MSVFRLPDLGEGLAEAEIVAWHVKVGERVRVDQPMVSVETAKAVVEVPVPYAGVIARLHGAAGDVLATGAPLIEFESDSASVVGTMPATSEEEYAEAGGAGIAPAPADAGTRPRALPVARALAARLGISLADVAGSGQGGVVTLDDVLQRSKLAPAPASGAASAIPGGEAAQPLRGTRRVMAQTMAAARDQVALSTVFDDADIEGWVHPGAYTLRVMRAMVHAWRIEPALNAWYDPAQNSRILCGHMDLGVAVDTEDGLLVPVLRHIDRQSTEQMRAALAQHKAAAHARTIGAKDLQNPTIMLSNFGTLAGRYAVPQVVPPAVAILGSGRVREDAVAIDGRIEARRRVPLSLSFDHRCVTGGEACRYLAAIIEDLEKTE